MEEAATVDWELRDIKPLVDIPGEWTWLWWLLAALALAAAAFWLWRHRRSRPAPAPVVTTVPPHLRARRKLEQALALLSDPRPFTILVSDTIRVYLEERFALRAPERTTEEFLYELQDTRLLAPEHKASLGEFLSRCDLVKFARYQPAEAELLELHRAAVRLVDETEPRALDPELEEAGS